MVRAELNGAMNFILFMSTTPPYSPKNLRNRPFYRYGGHIELLRLEEYCGMPRGHEHDPIYSLSIYAFS